jgi:UDP-glucuronate decarboxylase
MAISPIFDKKNILVFGGAGFIGSHLCDELIQENKVICVDNFITGKERNIEHLLVNPDFEFVKHDTTQSLDLEKLPELKKFKVEYQGVQEIYYLASPSSPKAYNLYPIETLLANSSGVKNALDLAVKYNAKFLFASSSAIYGEPNEEKTLFREDYYGYFNPVGPRSCYAEAKRFGESLTMNYRNKFNLDTKIVRIFNTYGPRLQLDDGRMIPEMTRQALNNEEIVIYGNEGSFGSYCYIADLIKALTKMMSSAESGPINLGSEWENNLTDIAKIIISLTGSQSKIVYQSLSPLLARQGIADISMAKEKLGWFPVVLITDGLKETVEYLKASKDLLEAEQLLK